VQLADRLHHRPDELSGGERQRVAIARALSVYPPILLADEPTGNLDTRPAQDILALIRDLHERLGATVVIVTHDRQVAASCERTVTLRDGRIVGGRRGDEAARAHQLAVRAEAPAAARADDRGHRARRGGVRGMHTANQSVLVRLRQTIDRIAGKTELQVTAGETGFGEDVLEACSRRRACAWRCRSSRRSSTSGCRAGHLLVLGVDMTGDRSLRDYDLEEGDEAIVDDPLVFLAQPDSLIVTREFAERHGSGGAAAAARTMEGEKAFTVRGIMQPSGLASAFGGNLAIMDVYAAQMMFGRGRTFDRIDLAVRRARRGRVPARAAPCWAGFRGAAAGEPGPQFEAMLAGYTVMVSISSAFALFIGMFIIYNAFAIAVTQRRSEIGILRALGATRGQVRWLFLGESAVLGGVGSLLGLGVGVLIARAIAGVIGGLASDRVRRRAAGRRGRDQSGAAGAGAGRGRGTSSWPPRCPPQRGARRPGAGAAEGRTQVLSAARTAVRRARRRGRAPVDRLPGGRRSERGRRSTPATRSPSPPPCCSRAAAVARAGAALRPCSRWLRPVEGALAADSLIQAPRRTSPRCRADALARAGRGVRGMARASYGSIVDWMDTVAQPRPLRHARRRASTCAPRGFRRDGAEIAAVPGVARVQRCSATRGSRCGARR
jgi:putative ABC transport system permease protein